MTRDEAEEILEEELDNPRGILRAKSREEWKRINEAKRILATELEEIIRDLKKDL